MINKNEYKFINQDRSNNTCELNKNDINIIRHNLLNVTFNLKYPAYLNIEIIFKSNEQLTEKLIQTTHMSKGMWIWADAHLAANLDNTLKTVEYNYDSLIVEKVKLYHTKNRIYEI